MLAFNLWHINIIKIPTLRAGSHKKYLEFLVTIKRKKNLLGRKKKTDFKAHSHENLGLLNLDKVKLKPPFNY